MKTGTITAQLNLDNIPVRKNCREAVLLDGQDYYVACGTEYIADCDSLINLDGKAMKRRRSLIRRFKAVGGSWSFEEITAENIDLAFNLERPWQRDEADGEAAFVRRCFRGFTELGLIGGILRSGETEVGYSISASCGSAGALILVLRASPVPAGASAMLYRQTALLLRKRIPSLTVINLGCCGGAVEEQNRIAYHSQIIITGRLESLINIKVGSQ